MTISPSPSPDTLIVQPIPTPTPQSQQHVPENTQITTSESLPVTTTLSAPIPIPAVTSGVSSSPSQPHIVPVSPIASLTPPVVVSVAQSTASTSTGSTPTSITTRRTSTFRHVPSRAPSTPIAPFPLSIGNQVRASSLHLRNLDSNKASRPHSRLSTVSLFNNSSPIDIPEDAPTSNAAAAASTQPQGDPNQQTLTKTVGGTSLADSPVPMQRTSSATPSLPPAVPSSFISSLPSSTQTSTPVRSPAPYRPGFQPKGVYRPLTDEFLEMRRSRRDSGRIEQTRLERRLEKLINLHFGEGTDKRVPARPKQVRRVSSIWELDIRNMGPGDLWRGVIQSQVASGGKSDFRGVFLCSCLERTFGHYRRLVAAEQNITPWQSDVDVSQCPSCACVA